MNRRLVVDDGRTTRELLLIGTMVVGRDPECEISDRDPRLSRRHAEFRLGEHGVTVRDLESRNGIRVNGRAVKEALLRPGDLVQIAQLTVRFVDDDGTVTPARRSGPAALPSTLTVAPSAEDDRTRIAASGAFSAALAHVAVAAVGTRGAGQRDDDRTRIAGSPVPTVSAAPVKDLADVVFREPGPVPPSAGELGGVGSLARLAWGRRVLLQGLMLALVVFVMSTLPLLVWQRRVFGVTAVQSLAVLVPPLVASAAAGVLVAALIARTAARGSRAERHGRR